MRRGLGLARLGAALAAQHARVLVRIFSIRPGQLGRGRGRRGVREGCICMRARLCLVVGSTGGGGQRSAARMAKQMGIAREGRARRRAEFFFCETRTHQKCFGMKMKEKKTNERLTIFSARVFTCLTFRRERCFQHHKAMREVVLKHRFGMPDDGLGISL